MLVAARLNLLGDANTAFCELTVHRSPQHSRTLCLYLRGEACSAPSGHCVASDRGDGLCMPFVSGVDVVAKVCEGVNKEGDNVAVRF